MVAATVVRYQRQEVEYESPRAQQILRILARLCQIGNRRRELFVDDNVLLETYAPGASRHLRFHMQHILSAATYFYALFLPDIPRVDIRVGSVTEGRELGRLCMHLWYCRTPDDDTVLAHMLLPFAIDAINEFSPEDFFSFFENQAVRPMCPSDFLKSVCAYLRFDGFSEPDVKRVLLRGLCPIIG